MKNWEIKIRKKSNFNDASVHGSKMSENVTRPYCVIYLLLFPVWQHWRWAMRATIICLPLSNWLTCGFLIQRESMIKLHRSVKVNNMDTHVAVESNKKKMRATENCHLYASQPNLWPSSSPTQKYSLSNMHSKQKTKKKMVPQYALSVW